MKRLWFPRWPFTLSNIRRKSRRVRASMRLERLEERSVLAAIVVTNLDDAGPGSLRQAILDANTNMNPEPDTITFAANLSGGTINLMTVAQPDSALVVTVPLIIDATSLPAGITLDASGLDPTPAANEGNGARVLLVSDGNVGNAISVTVRGITVTGGDVNGDGGGILSLESLTLRDTTISGNVAVNDGGGLFGSGTTTLTNVTIADNATTGLDGDGGGAALLGTATVSGSSITGNSTAGAVADGGGLFGNAGTVNLLTIQNTTISGNTSGEAGGGVYTRGSLLLANSTISGNSTSGGMGNGGGLYTIVMAGETVSISNSTISGNTTSGGNAYGGGISASIYAGGRLSLVNSTITGNSTTGPNAVGGGVDLGTSGDGTANIANSTISGNTTAGINASGGGVFVYSSAAAGPVVITSSTISGNTTIGGSAYGAGLNAAGVGSVQLLHSTFTNNRVDNNNVGAATGGGVFIAAGLNLTLQHTIVARNLADGATDDDISGTVLAASAFNLVGVNANLVGIANAVNGNRIGTLALPVDPLLGPLANNGGPTRTHALLPGSPAIHAGNPAFVPPPNFDQRGLPFVRVEGPAVDIGAVEFAAPDPLGPRVTGVAVGRETKFDLFDPKPADGPTPLANILVIDFEDLPERFPGFTHPALDPIVASQRFNYRVIGDHNGVIPIKTANVLIDALTGTVQAVPAPTAMEFSVVNDVAGQAFSSVDDFYNGAQLQFTTGALAGQSRAITDYNGVTKLLTTDAFAAAPAAGDAFVIIRKATARVELEFFNALPDDRFTLTVFDALVDGLNNALDGESDAAQPSGAPTFPSGNGVSGGDFVARFTIDSRPEIGVWAGGSVVVDTNGNFVLDPQNADFTNRDLLYKLGFISDYIFAGNFAPAGQPAADGFDKLAAYGRGPDRMWRWLIDFNHDGVPDAPSPAVDGRQVNGFPVSGNFDGNLANGDEIGVFEPRTSTWHLDGLGGVKDYNVVNDTPITPAAGQGLRGFPIVGEFNGDGMFDLATYRNDLGRFEFSLSIGGAAPTGNVNRTVQFDFAGVLERPLAHDMNQDGFDDLGLWVPNRNLLTPRGTGQFYFLLSGDSNQVDGNLDGQPDSVLDRVLATPFFGDTIPFTPAPFGNDLFAEYGDEVALPLVGNFDPPVTPGFQATPVRATTAPSGNSIGRSTVTPAATPVVQVTPPISPTVVTTQAPIVAAPNTATAAVNGTAASNVAAESSQDRPSRFRAERQLQRVHHETVLVSNEVVVAANSTTTPIVAPAAAAFSPVSTRRANRGETASGEGAVSDPAATSSIVVNSVAPAWIAPIAVPVAPPAPLTTFAPAASVGSGTTSAAVFVAADSNIRPADMATSQPVAVAFVASPALLGSPSVETNDTAGTASTANRSSGRRRLTAAATSRATTAKKMATPLVKKVAKARRK